MTNNAMQQPQNVFARSPASAHNVARRPSSLSTMLPGRTVTSDTIEDTYVQFILCCNPAVPADTDTAVLREAFQTPPKSGGKTFNTFRLFELIKQLEAKELKTWAELALKLGVEPPDQDKGQSSQKIQQYAVRLKVFLLLSVFSRMHADCHSAGCTRCTWMPSSSTCLTGLTSTGRTYRPTRTRFASQAETASLRKTTWR